MLSRHTLLAPTTQRPRPHMREVLRLGWGYFDLGDTADFCNLVSSERDFSVTLMQYRVSRRQATTELNGLLQKRLR